MTFTVAYPTTLVSPNNKVTIRSSNLIGDCGTPKSLTITRSSSCKIASEDVVSDEFSVVAYPNPSSDVFTLDVQSSSKGATGVQVYDMAGRLIEQRQVNSDDQIGSNYASGIYNVIVTQGANVKTLRVIKR